MKPIKAQNGPGASAAPTPGVLPLDPSSARYPSGGKIVRLDFTAEQLRSSTERSSNSQLVQALAGSATFRDFQRDFEDATLLPLSLRAVESWQLAHTGSQRLNGFCALLSQKNHSCASCLRMQQRVCEGVNGVSCTMSCSFGLKETAVGVKVGKDIVAYLQTGQVFFKPPTPLQTRRALQQIKEWGLNLDEVEAARCYNATPVVGQRAYEATVRLLQFFADQLGPMTNQIVLHRQAMEPVQITRARNFIDEQHQKKLSLPVVARHVGMSPYHFCKTFKKVTGVKFTKYVSRIRVKEAKNLLSNLNFRLGEVGYHVGFQSLTHFNRAFKSIAGESPKEYRARLPSA
jgi:AraC-like DNA-binding protein